MLTPNPKTLQPSYGFVFRFDFRSALWNDAGVAMAAGGKAAHAQQQLDAASAVTQPSELQPDFAIKSIRDAGRSVVVCNFEAVGGRG